MKMVEEALIIDLETKSQTSAIMFTGELPTTDGQLVDAVLAGDEQAFAEIFERYRSLVARVVGRFFRDRGDIEEFVQQAFTKAYFSLNKFQGENDRSLAAWISRIAVNVCYDEFRRRKRSGQYASVEMSEEENGRLAELADGTASSAERSMIATQLAEKVLSSLSPEDRIAMTMIYSEEYSLEEVAGAIGISVSNLKSRLFRCRNQLKTRFGYLFK